MSSSENAEVRDRIERAFIGEFGGRASSDDVFRQVAPHLSDDLMRHLAAPGLKAAIGRYFREKRRDGLPHAPEVNADGQHVQLDLLEVPEFEYAVASYLKSSEASYQQAEKLAALCLDVHGVAIRLNATEAAA